MDLDRLTVRQEEMLRDLCSGASDAEIAARRGIVARSVKAYRSTILLRLRAPRGATFADVCRALAARNGRLGDGPRERAAADRIS